MADPFDGAITRPEQLRDFYDSPMEPAIRKDIGRIDELCRRLIAAAPMLFVATHAEGGRAALIFVIPGRDTTLRVNGSAVVTAEPELLERLTPVGKPPLTAIVVRAEEVYAHCPKAFVRSRLWDPESWADPATPPTSAEVSLAHQRNPELTLERVEERERDSLANRLE
jgi:uncharacterized protein